MISIGLMGSHSCRYMVRALFFLFFSFLSLKGRLQRKISDSYSRIYLGFHFGTPLLVGVNVPHLKEQKLEELVYCNTTILLIDCINPYSQLYGSLISRSLFVTFSIK